MRPAAVSLLVAGILAAAELDLPAARQVTPDTQRLVEPSLVAQDLPGPVHEGAEVNGFATQDQRLVVHDYGQAQGQVGLAAPGRPAVAGDVSRGLVHGERTSRAWNAKEFRQVRCAPPRPFPFDFQRPLVRIAAQQ